MTNQTYAIRPGLRTLTLMESVAHTAACADPIPTPKRYVKGFGLARAADGRVVVREGTVRGELGVIVNAILDARCPCEMPQTPGTATMCWMCSGPKTLLTVDHTDGDL